MQKAVHILCENTVIHLKYDDCKISQGNYRMNGVIQLLTVGRL